MRKPHTLVMGLVIAMTVGGRAYGAENAPNPRKAVEHSQRGSSEIQITTVSARNDMVTGGDVLVRISAKDVKVLTGLRIKLNGADTTTAFRQTVDGTALTGSINGLRVGANLIEVSGPPSLAASLEITNFPISGPVFSGPHQQPFICQTQSFKDLPGKLGPAKDEDCSIERRIDYVYASRDNTFKLLTDINARPAGMATMKAPDGSNVPFIVRLETGTINRAIYQIAIPHIPSRREPNFSTPSNLWNGRLLYTFGGGCQAGWYIQGPSTGGVLDISVLSRGYAIASSSLNVFGNNCNDLLASETLMMVKERFIEGYGVPQATMGWGSSGGSYQQHQSADNYPGLLDSLLTGSSFPDVGVATIYPAADAWLLQMYFMRQSAGNWTPAQQRAVSGFGSLGSIQEMTNRAQRINPIANWSPAVPKALRYDVESNPAGARATVYDHTLNVYGKDPQTGFARRPLDNVGVQYGLKAFNDGVISTDQFLDLNENIGGFDNDARYQTERMVADTEALRLAYATGRVLHGGGGLGSLPIIDYRTYLDHDPAGNVHQRYHTFSTRDRLIKSNGNADNRVMLTEDTRPGALALGGHSAVWLKALELEAKWLDAVAADTNEGSRAEKVVRNKPKELVDACWTPDARPIKLAEPQTIDGDGLCNRLYPSYSSPRMVAGAPVAADVVKCQLKTVDLADYKLQSFSSDQETRLRRIFPDGVCDYSQPGIGQVPPIGTWLTFGPSGNTTEDRN
jgi:hypothetical protein